MDLQATLKLPMTFSVSARYDGSAGLNSPLLSLYFQVLFACYLLHVDPDLYAVKNVENLIILKR